jgi:hypothetical protein
VAATLREVQMDSRWTPGTIPGVHQDAWLSVTTSTSDHNTCTAQQSVDYQQFETGQTQATRVDSNEDVIVLLGGEMEMDKDEFTIQPTACIDSYLYRNLP